MEQGEAFAAVEAFVEQVVEFRRKGEPGSHWPEYVWTTMLVEALAGLDVLRPPPELARQSVLVDVNAAGGRVIVTDMGGGRKVYQYEANGCYGSHVTADARAHSVRGDVRTVGPSWLQIFAAAIAGEQAPAGLQVYVAELVDADGRVVNFCTRAG